MKKLTLDRIRIKVHGNHTNKDVDMDYEINKNIAKLIEKLGISPYDFSKQIGNKRPDNIYNVINCKVKVSPKTLDKIISTYPEYRQFIITGEGESLTPPTNDAQAICVGKVIPYFDTEVAAGTAYGMDMTQTRQVGMIEIGGLLRDSEFALRVYGNSMTPNYPAGCVVGLKQHTDSFIEPGMVYVIETRENRYLKRLYYNGGRDAFRCISDNTMKYENGPMTGEYFYQEFEIPLKDVSRLFRVTGVIKRNIL